MITRTTKLEHISALQRPAEPAHFFFRFLFLPGVFLVLFCQQDKCNTNTEYCTELNFVENGEDVKALNSTYFGFINKCHLPGREHSPDNHGAIKLS